MMMSSRSLGTGAGHADDDALVIAGLWTEPAGATAFCACSTGDPARSGRAGGLPAVRSKFEVDAFVLLAEHLDASTHQRDLQQWERIAS